MTAKAAKLWIGPAGWSYPDWDGIFYPQTKPRGFKPLAYLARHLNAVEVNSSFYRVPTARMTAAWIKQVPADFRFTFKLTRSFTHERAAFPPTSEAAAFREALQPVAAAGRLGPVLIQFPWSFRYTPENAEWLKRISGALSDLDRCVEVRHASWTAPEALHELAAIGAFCNIDQPRLHDCIGPTTHVFGRDAYVRLHGRNAANWFAENQPAFERYNYLYSESELAEWVDRLRTMADQAEQVYVFANNHYRAQGPANALELRALLEGQPVDVPLEMLTAFPRLRRYAKQPRDRGLFE